MILLDTNVLSALMRADAADPAVAWLDAQATESVWTSSVNVFEVRFGLETLTKGRRRRALEDAFERMLEEDLENRVLPFDDEAARAAALIAAGQRQAGRVVEIRDVEIAGIAAVRKATLATRNTRHFEGIGLNLIDPWRGK